MKKIISAIMPENHPAFGQLETSAYNLGYTLSVDDNFDITLTHKDPLMPKIKVVSGTMGKEHFYTPTLTFPVLTESDDDFPDTIEWYLGRWYDVGKFITKLSTFSFNPSDY